MDLSIVIPVYNEADKIARDVAAAAAFLRNRQLAGEIIVVDDGSNDASADNALAAAQDQVELHLLRHPTNRGKGAAVRTGIIASRGRYVMFADSGLCVPFDQADRGLQLLRSGACDLAHGSRRLRETRILRTPAWHRRIASRIFRIVARRLLGLPDHLTDTQMGFKLYHGDLARELYQACRTERFMFDVEIILRALRRDRKICEFPVTWHSDRDTRFLFLHHSLRSLYDLLEIKHRLKNE